jgi:hypothetical protein
MKDNMQPIVLGAIAGTLEPNLDVLTGSKAGCECCDATLVDAYCTELESPFESDGTLKE